MRSYLVAALVLVSACNENVVKGGGGGGRPVLANCGLVPISYAEVHARIFSDTTGSGGCMSCHAGMGTYAGVTGRIADIQDAIFTDRMPLPPFGPVTQDDKILLMSWVNQGAPERAEDANMDCSGEDPVVEQDMNNGAPMKQ